MSDVVEWNAARIDTDRVLRDAASILMASAKKGFGNHNCASYVRDAFDHAFAKVGMKPISPRRYAYEYGSSYLEAGFQLMESGQLKATQRDPDIGGRLYSLRVGDVAVFGPNATHPAGHAQMFTPDGWYSDFKQAHFVPWPAQYEDVSYSIYALLCAVS